MVLTALRLILRFQPVSGSFCRTSIIAQNNDLIRVHEVQAVAGPFVDHIGIEALGAQQHNAPFHGPSSLLQRVELQLQIVGISLQLPARDQPIITRKGVKRKIK